MSLPVEDVVVVVVDAAGVDAAVVDVVVFVVISLISSIC